MYAVILTGGKQYRVSPGRTYTIEKLDAAVGDTVVFDQVLLLADADGKLTVGSPLVKGQKISAEVVNQFRDKKVKIIKFKRRKHHLKRQGHRQSYTQVKITGFPGASAAKPAAAKKATADKPAAPAKKAAAKKAPAKKPAAKPAAAAKKPAAKKPAAKKPAAKKAAAKKSAK